VRGPQPGLRSLDDASTAQEVAVGAAPDARVSRRRR